MIPATSWTAINEANKILGLSIEEQIRRTIDGNEWQIIRPDGSPMHTDEYASTRALKEHRPVENVEMGLVKGADKITWINVSASPILLENYGVVISYNDITEKKNTKEALEKSLQENKDLLRELQHRAKNSFSMIHSMILLMGESSSSDEAKSVLIEACSKINAVSEMYDLLYETDSATEVRLDEYLYRVANSLPITKSNITIENNCDPATVPVKIGIYVGLITAEFVTNSIKHAFPGKRKGTITMTLKKTNSGALLEIKDDGVGLPEGFDLSKSDSLGLTLVNTLASQIEGSFKIESKKGTPVYCGISDRRSIERKINYGYFSNSRKSTKGQSD